MPTINTLLLFTAISAGVIVVPGPSNMFILTRGITRGRSYAFAATLGVAVASALRVILAITGLAALVAASPIALTVVEWAGVAYLAWLGLHALIHAHRDAGTPLHQARVTSMPGQNTGRDPGPTGWRDRRTMRAGLIIGLANPKMLLFYLAFLPQFIDPSRGPKITQILILGGVFWILGTLWDLWFAYAAGRVGSWLENHPGPQRALPRIEATTYLALAGLTIASV